jgi:hypothetical protein
MSALFITTCPPKDLRSRQQLERSFNLKKKRGSSDGKIEALCKVVHDGEYQKKKEAKTSTCVPSSKGQCWNDNIRMSVSEVRI